MYCRLSYSALIFVHNTSWLGSTGASVTNNASDSNDISVCQTPSLSHSVKSLQNQCKKKISANLLFLKVEGTNPKCHTSHYITFIEITFPPESSILIC